MSSRLLAEIVFLSLFLSCLGLVGGLEPLSGRWELVLNNAGVSAMHMTLLHTNKVLIFDQTLAGPSQIRRTDPPCNHNTNITTEDCWAHSIEYDIATNTIRPLHVIRDTFCSSGSFATNGTLIQTGGWNNGDRVTRYFTPCVDKTCEWVESSSILSSRRWYASNQILPNGRVFVLGGRRSFNYEFVPKNKPTEGAFSLPFLVQTYVPNVENNLYPFVHLSSDGNLFVFSNQDSILLDYAKNKIVRSFPTLPGGGRNYPSSGSSVMLPLDSSNNFSRVEILICGGAPDGAFTKATFNKTFVEALKTCGRLDITSKNPQWQMENMPTPRVMGDMLILPTGEILIINGAMQGTAGYQSARKPALNPLLYRSVEAVGKRFSVLAPSEIPRVYHSTANVLPDGRVLVGGSNSNYGYKYSGVPFPTELRIEAYSPYYLDAEYDWKRVSISSVSSREIKYGSRFVVGFSVAVQPPRSEVRFNVYAPPFTTHAWSMNQRMLSLATTRIVKARGAFFVGLRAPPSAVAAPSGYYLLSVVNGGVPSRAEWIRFLG